MQPDPSRKPDDREPASAEAATQNEVQDAAAENVRPIVLPAAVPVEQPPADALPPQAPRAVDILTVTDPPPEGPGDAAVPLEPGTGALPTEVRQFVDQLRPRPELPLPEDDFDAEDEDITMEEAVGHFVSLAEERMRELNIGGGRTPGIEQSVLRGGTPDGIQRGVLRHDADRGAPQLLSDSSSGGQSDGGSPRISLPSVSQGDAPPLDGALPPIVVQMADARADYAQAIEEALDKHERKYRDIAASEVKFGFWQHGNLQRAADWRLRA